MDWELLEGEWAELECHAGGRGTGRWRWTANHSPRGRMSLEGLREGLFPGSHEESGETGVKDESTAPGR